MEQPDPQTHPRMEEKETDSLDPLDQSFVEQSSVLLGPRYNKGKTWPHTRLVCKVYIPVQSSMLF